MPLHIMDQFLAFIRTIGTMITASIFVVPPMSSRYPIKYGCIKIFIRFRALLTVTKIQEKTVYSSEFWGSFSPLKKHFWNKFH